MHHIPSPPQDPGSQPYPQEAPGATAGLVLGVCSIVFSMPIVGLMLGFIGLLKSKEARGYTQSNPAAFNNAGVAQAGFVCSIIGLVLGCFTTLCGSLYILAIIAAIAGAAAGDGGSYSYY